MASRAINSEIWAESGGTGGMFGKLWEQGRLNIVSRELTTTEQATLEKAVAENFKRPITI